MKKILILIQGFILLAVFYLFTTDNETTSSILKPWSYISDYQFKVENTPHKNIVSGKNGTKHPDRAQAQLGDPLSKREDDKIIHDPKSPGSKDKNNWYSEHNSSIYNKHIPEDSDDNQAVPDADVPVSDVLAEGMGGVREPDQQEGQSLHQIRDRILDEGFDRACGAGHRRLVRGGLT